MKEKVVLITGASSGIGRASAKQFAAAGARLLLCARRHDVLKGLAKELVEAFGIEVHTFCLDVRYATNVTAALDALPTKWKNIDVLVNNAGLAAGLAPLQEGLLDDWESMIDTNIKGLLYVTRAILPQMVKKNSGHVINIGSIAGHEVYPNGAVYCATKQAVNVLTRGMRMDLYGTKVRVSTIDPGAVETHFSEVRFKGDVARAAAVYQGMTPLTPEDVAEAILYCATRPAHVNISEIIMMPTDQASATMVFRE